VALCIIQVPDANLVFEADVLLSDEPAQVVGWRKVHAPTQLAISALVSMLSSCWWPACREHSLDAILVLDVASAPVPALRTCKYSIAVLMGVGGIAPVQHCSVQPAAGSKL